MMGLMSFFLLLLGLILITLASVSRQRGYLKYAAASIIFASIAGWYEYIFSAKDDFLFFFGSFAMVIAVSGFLYSIYSLDWLNEDGQELSTQE